ncbi:MAG TPA: HAMP domain-containing sensor histidine kinase [bacterium]|nr:HAMP domain-containing sensor histidine kinase [bacterium]
MQQENVLMGIMHEIKNTTATMNGFLQLLAKRVHNDDCIQRYVQILFNELNALERLIGDGFYLCQMEEVSFRRCDMVEILEGIGKRAALIAEEKGSRIHVKTRPCPPIDGVPVLLRQLLWNLVENALAALSKSGEITLELTTGKDGWLRIACCDTGAGITAADLTQIFCFDFTTKTNGMGLGLPFCRQIAKLHGGQLDVESKPGVGTCFILHLPITKDR